MKLASTLGLIAPLAALSFSALAADQVKIVQIFLRELHFYRDTPDGRLGPATRAAIQDYQRAMGLKIRGSSAMAWLKLVPDWIRSRMRSIPLDRPFTRDWPAAVFSACFSGTASPLG